MMSTTGIESWAVDLKDVGAIYPFQGSEGLLVVIGVVTWIAWHIWQSRWEKEKYEKHHNIIISDDAISACVELSDRYISDRYLPDKAIDVMDEAGSRIRISNVNVPDDIILICLLYTSPSPRDRG